jgi:hypothetical protein
MLHRSLRQWHHPVLAVWIFQSFDVPVQSKIEANPEQVEIRDKGNLHILDVTFASLFVIFLPLI